MSEYLAPAISPETQPYWDAARRRQLAIPFCAKCNAWSWPPVGRCARCDSPNQWRAVSGEGVVETFSVVHRPPKKKGDHAEPYVLAFVMLNEGVRIFAAVAAADPASIVLRTPVTVDFHPIADSDLLLPVFMPR